MLVEPARRLYVKVGRPEPFGLPLLRIFDIQFTESAVEHVQKKRKEGVIGKYAIQLDHKSIPRAFLIRYGLVVKKRDAGRAPGLFHCARSEEHTSELQS